MEHLAKKITQFIRKNEEKYCKLSQEIWQYAELAFHEEKSSQALIRMLEQEGFQITAGLADIPTGIHGPIWQRKTDGGYFGRVRCTAFFKPEGGMQPPGRTGARRAGHGCGHNLLGVGAAAAAVAVKDYMEETGLGGTIVFYGCPAEENGSAKVYLSRDGVFDHLDGVFTWHPGSNNSIMGEHSPWQR